MRMLARDMNMLMWRRGLAPLLLLMIALIVSNCSGNTGSLFKDSTTTPGPAGKPVPPIALQTMVGLPIDKAQALREALSAAAGQRDMAIVEGNFQTGQFVLNGNFQTVPEGGGIRVSYQWTLTGDDGATLHTLSGSEFSPDALEANPWSAMTPDVLEKIAVATAGELASRLSQLGYATRAAALHLPPPEYFIAAAPGAYKEIDYETLLGPGAVEPVMAAVEQPSVLVPPVEEPIEAVAGEAEEAPNTIGIRAVAVLSVKGSPGSGNDELTRAMRQTLKTAGWPVLSQPRADAITIRGKVKIDAARGDSQQVALIWTVHSPDGRKLGKIDQANGVPAGSLDEGWGDNAIAVAEAAATGIFDLIKVYR